MKNQIDKTKIHRCGNILSKCLTLVRVLPLPSHNWDSGASEWYVRLYCYSKLRHIKLFRPSRNPCGDGTFPTCTCADGSSPTRKSPCADGNRPTCAGGVSPRCNDGSAPIPGLIPPCSDGPPKCQDGGPISCADGTRIPSFIANMIG